MKIDNLLTAEQMAAEPGFVDKLASFQRECDEVAGDIRKKFHVSSHEASHALQYRRRGIKVRFLGPYMSYDDENKKIRTALGAVLPVSPVCVCDWEQAAICMAGFVVTERITGRPEEEHVVDNDLRILRRKLEVSPRLPHTPEHLEDRLKYAKLDGEFMLKQEMEEPTFLQELEAVTREYEREIFKTDESWGWARKEYRLDLPGERYAVSLPYLGYPGLLIDDGKQAKLFVFGKEYAPSDRLYGNPLVLLSVRKDKRAENVVRTWNEQAAKTVEKFRRIKRYGIKPARPARVEV